TTGTAIGPFTTPQANQHHDTFTIQNLAGGGAGTKATIGNFSVDAAAITPTSYSTWGGTNPTSVTPPTYNGSNTSYYAGVGQATITLSTNPSAYNGIYTLTYSLATSAPVYSPTGSVKIYVETNINGGGWLGYGWIPVSPGSDPYP